MPTSPRSQIFVFTASNVEANHHLDVSIRNPIPFSLAKRFFKKNDHALLYKLDQEHGLYAWGTLPGGVNESRWQLMRPGDWILSEYHNDYHYVAQVAANFSNEGLANEIWGAIGGKTWSLMYFLTKPTEVYVPVADLSSYLHPKYMGFTRISDHRLSAIESQFGSITAFMEQALLGTAASVKKMTRDDVISAIQSFDAGTTPRFRNPRRHLLVFEERLYPPKAIYALASRRTVGRVLGPDDIDSGENSRCFQTLRSLGFQIRSHDKAKV